MPDITELDSHIPEFSMNRRDMLLTSGAALSGLALSGTSAAASSRRITGIPGKKLVGCYLEIEDILDRPAYVDALQKELGINVVCCSPRIRISDRLKRMNPLKNTDTVMHVRGGVTDDDARAHKAIEEIHRRGMDFWIFFHGHHYGEEARHIMAETFEGENFLDLERPGYSKDFYKTVCFTKPEVQDWGPAIVEYTAKNYDCDAMYVSHFRYSNPSFWTNMLGCACSHCRAEAARIGADMDGMKRSVLGLLDTVRNADVKTLEHAADVRMTFTDFMSFLGAEDGVMDWLLFRSGMVSAQMKSCHDTVHSATNNRCYFVSDTHNATLAQYVGHNWEDFIAGANEIVMPLSWCESQYVCTLAAWAYQLCEWVDGLREPTALRLVQSILGWDDVGLSTGGIDDFNIAKSGGKLFNYNSPDTQASWGPFYDYLTPDRTLKLMRHEFARLKFKTSGRIPAYPVIQGREWPKEVCEELVSYAEELDFPGYFYRFTDVYVDKSNY